MAGKRRHPSSITNATTTMLSYKRCKNKEWKGEPKPSLPELRELSHQLRAWSSDSENLKRSVEILLSYITPSPTMSSESDTEVVIQSILSLQSFFVIRLVDGHMLDSELCTMFDDFVRRLIGIASSPLCKFHRIRMAVLEAIMVFVKLKKKGEFCFSLYQSLIQAVVYSLLEDDSFLDSVASNYFKYIDEMANKQGFLSKDSKNQVCLKLKAGKNVLDEKDKYAKKRLKLKLKFTKAWMSFLKLPLSIKVYKEVLVKLPQAVIPYLSKPNLLCDFLTRSYDIGGVVSVMALSGLFVLMTKHGLEYPNFYQKLYALLMPSLFMAKHCAKFFELRLLYLPSNSSEFFIFVCPQIEVFLFDFCLVDLYM